jgi:Glycosyltransferase family 87
MPARPPEGGSRSITGWLDRPLSGWWCAVGWLGSTAVFVGIVEAFGGPFFTDSQPSVESTLAIASGQVGCAFPRGANLTGPLYSFVSAAVAAGARFGNSIHIPHGTASSDHCAATLHAVDAWLNTPTASAEMLRIGYVGWVFLAAGLVLLLRASGRGRRVWEPTTLFIVACLPPVWLTLESSFHPQDLMSMGLALGAMAFALRDRWLIAGVLVTLGVMSQEFALLVAVPLLFIAPARRRPVFLVGAASTAILALAALLIGSSPRLVWDALFGSIYTSTTDTVVMALHLHGSPLVLLSKVLPVLISVVVSWRVVARRSTEAQGPVVLASLVAVSLSLRLVFEQNMFGYYYMALAVALVALSVIECRIRSSLVAWLFMVSLTYLAGITTTFVQLQRAPWGNDAQQAAVPLVILLALAMIGFGLARRARSSELLVWVALLCGCVLVWPSTSDPLSPHVSQMAWQILLVPTGVLLAARPLLARPDHDEQTQRTNFLAAVRTRR